MSIDPRLRARRTPASASMYFGGGASWMSSGRVMDDGFLSRNSSSCAPGGATLLKVGFGMYSLILFLIAILVRPFTLDVLDDALVLVGQVPRERVLGLVHVVVGVEHRVGELAGHLASVRWTARPSGFERLATNRTRPNCLETVPGLAWRGIHRLDRVQSQGDSSDGRRELRLHAGTAPALPHLRCRQPHVREPRCAHEVHPEGVRRRHQVRRDQRTHQGRDQGQAQRLHPQSHVQRGRGPRRLRT